MVKDEYSLIVEGKEEAQIVYEDELFLAFIAQEALADGQITIIPKEKYTIFEMVPNSVLLKLGAVIKTISTAVFESLQCHGTNVIIENGISAGQEVPYFSIQVIPRFQGDGIKLEWEGKELEEFDMENVMAQLKAQIQGSAAPIMNQDLQEKANEVQEMQENFEEQDFKAPPKKENYLLKSLRKIP